MDFQSPALRVGAEVGVFHRIHLGAQKQHGRMEFVFSAKPAPPPFLVIGTTSAPLPKREPSELASTDQEISDAHSNLH